MKTTARNLAAISSSLLFATSLSHAATIVDDFNNGNDNGWVRYDPIGLITGGAVASTYSFPDGNSYRIDATPSPNPDLMGPTRAGAYRPDAVFSNFRTSVDVIDWGKTENQFFSLVARGHNFGPGQTNGYGLTYFSIPSDNIASFQILRYDGEQSEPNDIDDLARLDFPLLDPDSSYRMVFTGVGSSLHGQLFDLSDLNTELFTVSITDSTYTSGNIGLLTGTAAFDETNPFQNNGTMATFDNFTAAIPEPGTAVLVALGCLGLLRRNWKIDLTG